MWPPMSWLHQPQPMFDAVAVNSGWKSSDAQVTCASPEKPIAFVWPDAVHVDGGLVGGVRLAWPQGADEDAPADWLVFGAMIRTVALGEEEAGMHPLSAALADEGFDDAGSGRLVESFARHLIAGLDAWNEGGFAEIAKSYLPRLTAEPGVRRDIDDNGDLLVRRTGSVEVERRALVPALATPSWLDPQTRGPR